MIEELQTVVKKTHTLFLVSFKLRTKHSLNFHCLEHLHFTSRLEDILKTSEDQVEPPSIVIRFDVVYPRVSLKTLKSKSVPFYSFF